MFFCCYKIANLVNGKVYIGKTNRPRERWLEHQSRVKGYHLSNAIQKYGVANFTFEIIAISELESEINKCEVFYIRQNRSNINRYGKSFGYNLTDGGEGVSGAKHTMETRAKMSASHMGYHPSEESLKKRSKSRTGILHTVKVREKIRRSRIGKKHSDETISKMRGENYTQSKLNWELVRRIREEYSNGTTTQMQLSAKYSISFSAIQKLLANKSWRI